MKPTWVIQANLIDVETAQTLASAAEDCGCETEMIHVIPMTEGLPAIKASTKTPVIFYGMTTLMKEAAKSAYAPGVWFDPNAFSYMHHVQMNPHKMLNFDCAVQKLGEANTIDPPFFVRPIGDLKEFAGFVINDVQDFNEWQKRLKMAELDELLDLDIIVSPVKKIVAEYRCFIVDSTPVDITQYKFNTFTRYERLAENSDTYRRIEDFVGETIRYPMSCCVADVAKLDNGDLKIIEFNTINASGFYKHDIPKIVERLTRYVDSFYP